MSNTFRSCALLLASLFVACAAGCSGDPPTESHKFAVAEIPVPAAIDSIGPNLAKGPDGTIVLSWIERDEESAILRYSRWSNGGWADPATVSSGENWFVNWADFPSVVPLSGTLWGAHWLTRRPAGGYAYDAYGAVSSDGGLSWSNGRPLHRDGTDTEHGFVSLYRDQAGVGAIWLDGRKMVNEVGPDPTDSGMTLRAATLSADAQLSNEQQVDELVCDCCQTDVAITSDGPLAVYRNRTVDEYRDIYVSRFESETWQPGRSVSDDRWEIHGCPVNGPTVAASGDAVAVAWFTVVDEIPRVRLARSRDAGRTFSPALDVVTSNTLGRVAATLLKNGGVVVAWLSSSGEGGHRLSLRQVSSSGALGPVQTVMGSVAGYSFPQMVAVDSRLLLVWTASRDAHTRVGSALISLGEIVE